MSFVTDLLLTVGLPWTGDITKRIISFDTTHIHIWYIFVRKYATWNDMPLNIFPIYYHFMRLKHLCHSICYHTNMHNYIQGNSKSLRDFRPLRYSSRDGHAEGEHVNRGRDTPVFCPTLQVLHMSTLGDAADVNPVIKFLPHMLQSKSICDCDLWRLLTNKFIKFI